MDGRGGAVSGYCGWKGRGSEWILWMEGGGAMRGYCGWKGEGQ